MKIHSDVRTDRTVSGCGLEPDCPLVTLIFTNVYVHPPSPSASRRRGEVSAQAFDGYLPDLFYGAEEAFSDRCSQESWSTIIETFVDGLVSDEAFAQASFEHGVPKQRNSFAPIGPV